MSGRSTRQSTRGGHSTQQPTRGGSSTRPLSRPTTRSTSWQGTTTGPAFCSKGRGTRRSPSPSRASTSSPAAKQHRRMDSLTRNDIPGIVAAVIQAMPNTTATSPTSSATLQSRSSNSATLQSWSSNSATLQSQASESAEVANPTSHAALSDEEQQHQELGEFLVTCNLIASPF